MAVALPFNPFAPDALAAPSSGFDIDDEVRLEGPYRVVLERLQRLVRYRAQMLVALQHDRADQKAAAELLRIRHMIKEAHRAVSINASAKATALRIDSGEPEWSASYE